ncbi:MAG: hypothetical protein AAF701_06975, partial [Pseudomonadota bacterium]
EEVTEEVRRDRLYGYLRRYGWIPALAIVAIVGGTAYFEYTKSQQQAAAQSRGDAILAALDIQDDAGRITALTDLVETDGSVVTQLLAARGDGAVDYLQNVAKNDDTPSYIRDAARLRLAALPDALSSEDRILVLEQLSAAGAQYRTPALDLLVLTHLDQGKTDIALALMQDAILDASVDRGQTQRFQQLIIALGQTPELANGSAPDSDTQ